jgi:sugar phosphate permease
VFVLHFSSNWFIYLLLTWLPTYLTKERHFSTAQVGAASAIPFLAALLAANVFAVVMAKLSLGRDRTLVRKSMLLLFVAGAAIFMLLPKIQSPLSAMIALVASTALVTSATPVYAAGSLELAPRYAGILTGMQQAFANLAGVATPLVAGYLARTCWSHVFLVTGTVCLAGAAVYAAFGSAETILSESGS